MPLIVDTCAAIWIVADVQISQPAIDAMDRALDRNEPVYVSPITAWEVGLLAAKGRLASPLPPETWFERLMSIAGLRLAELTPSIMIKSSFLPGEAPRDPSDRMIVATAREQDLTIVTRDRRILEYGTGGHVRTLAC